MKRVDPASKTEEIFLGNGDTLPARFNVDFRDIQEREKIGEGNRTVHKARWFGLDVAVKKFNLDKTFSNVSLTSKEVTRMLRLRHPNVLKVFGFYLLAQEDLVLQCSMIMELMDCDLHKFIEQRQGVQNDEALYIIAEIARGMKHMHEFGYFHRDLKPRNVLIKKSDVTSFHIDVKIADFGDSEIMGDGSCNRMAGTSWYRAPEQFDLKVMLMPDKVDVFSFGALCFKLLTGEEPFKDPLQMIEHFLKCDRNLPDGVTRVIKECLGKNPEARPDFQKICGVLDPILEEIWDSKKKPEELVSEVTHGGSFRFLQACQRSIFSHPEELVSEERHGLDLLESRTGFSKDYIKDYFIPFTQLTVRRQIGKGAYSDIYEVEWKGTLYAQKIFNDASRLSFFSDPLFRIELPKLNYHKNIVAFVGYSTSSDNRFGFVMERMPLDLDTFILEYYRRLQLHNEGDSEALGGRNSPFDDQESRYIMKEIAEGMAYLHDRDVYHGDLKPQNVMLSAGGMDDRIVKLIDFGCDPLCCSIWSAAPEILATRKRPTQKTIDFKKADVYSFGKVCYSIVGGKDHYDGRLGPEPRAVIEGMRSELPKETSQDLKCLIERCWHQNPLVRPSFLEICEFFDPNYAGP